MKILLALCALVACTAALGQSSYVCTVEKTVAFKFDKQSKTWSNVSFAMKDEYVIRRPNPKDSPSEQKAAWIVKRGINSVATCEHDFSVPADNLLCEGWETFRFGRKRMRFVSAFLMGYFSDDLSGRMALEEGSNEPTLNIGQCSPA